MESQSKSAISEYPTKDTDLASAELFRLILKSQGISARDAQILEGRHSYLRQVARHAKAFDQFSWAQKKSSEGIDRLTALKASSEYASALDSSLSEDSSKFKLGALKFDTPPSLLSTNPTKEDLAKVRGLIDAELSSVRIRTAPAVTYLEGSAKWHEKMRAKRREQSVIDAAIEHWTLVQTMAEQLLSEIASVENDTDNSSQQIEDDTAVRTEMSDVKMGNNPESTTATASSAQRRTGGEPEQASKKPRTDDGPVEGSDE